MNKDVSALTRRIIEFSLLPGVGAMALRKIITHIATGRSVDEWDAREVMAKYGRPSKKQISSSLQADVDRVLAACKSDAQGVISPLDPDFPAPLKHISDFPPLLYYKGELSSLNKKGVAVVGTREVSRLGVSWARQIAAYLAEHNVSVVSGLALGVDAAAHEGALSRKGVTTAVLAHGLDKISPASNRPLAESIIKEGGALVGEHPPGTPPRRPEYVRRNRIQSGMSVASIIVESGEVGGAIHQGRFTHEQERFLICIRPPEGLMESGDFNYGGANFLVSQFNAKAISSSAELAEFIQSPAFENAFLDLQASPWTEGKLL
ncbi:DNA-processing protein DprA [Roseovarius sp.]|uniref:DNA-processing protein DprA n=1 Tax=Roseovarius sp. TaxID=1486281 RepID=UPI003A9752F5